MKQRKNPMTFDWSLWCAFMLKTLSLSLVCVYVCLSKRKEKRKKERVIAIWKI